MNIPKYSLENRKVEEGTAAPMDGGKSDAGEGECSAERSCHPGF